MFSLRIFISLCFVFLHAASGAMPAQDFNIKSAYSPTNTCANSYQIQSEEESASQLFSVGLGLMGIGNSFEAETLIHTRVLTDQGYVKQLKRIADIQVGDEVLAWDEVKAFDIAQAKENLKLQANLQVKSADSRQEMCAECYENSSNAASLQQTLLQSAVGTQLTASAESYQKVTHLMSSVKEQKLYFITLDNGEVFTATAGHPFKTSEGWRDAVMLKKGGKLLLKGGEGGEGDDSPFALSPSKGERYATITSIREEVQTIRMFNFEVAQLHTYFIGVDGVVVHNGVRQNNSAGAQHEQNVADAINNQGVHDARRERQRVNTPLGPRYPDVTVRNKSDGSIVGFLECKKGGSRYKPSQRAKDEWIRQNMGITTTLVRG